VNLPGTYTVAIRNRDTGRTDQCSHSVTRSNAEEGGDQDPDEVIYDNCPRAWQFWRRVFDGRGNDAEAQGISDEGLGTIALIVDERSSYFNWSNDVTGLRQALAPASPLTRRKQVARQYAAFLANIVAGERNLLLRDGDRVGLDPETRGSYAGATTLRELAEVTDRTLRAKSGNYTKLNSTLDGVNRGRGIGSVCE